MTLFSNWHFMRIFRAAVAVWAVFEYTRTSDWAILLIGGFFAVQAIFDLGCGGASGCATASPAQKRQDFAAQEIEYDEVK